MMRESHQDAISWLVIVIAIMMVAIFFVLIAAVWRQQKQKKQSPTTEQIPNQTTVSSEPSQTVHSALSKTQDHFFGRLKKVFISSEKSPAFEEIEEILYTCDFGPRAVQKLSQKLEEQLSSKQLSQVEQLKSVLKQEILSSFESAQSIKPQSLIEQVKLNSEKPFVVMIVGVNGAGKTTTLGKISALAAQSGLKVLVAAGDTFRAAASEQLQTWTTRAQVEIFSPEGVRDPSAVAFDAVSKGQAQGYDLVLIDTAGRLHTQANLMDELKKVKKVIQKKNAIFPQEVLIVLDANSGQNALLQAKEFDQAVQLTGAIMTKMDGTAKGGVCFGLVEELHKPVRMIGIGEKISDLKNFDAHEYVDSILG